MSALGLDIGTTGVKACAFSAGGRLLARAYREYPLRFPRPGWIELDPRRVLAAARAVVRDAASGARRAGDPVRAVAVSAQGEAVTPVDAAFRPLDYSPVTFDARTAPYVAWWEQRLGARRFFELSGMPLHGMYTLPKVQWWKDQRPALYRKARYFLCYEDLAAAALFGVEPVIGTSLAGRTGGYDLKSRGWSRALFRSAGVDPARFARPVPAGAPVGLLSARAARGLGLDSGTLYVAGGHDQALCALGCGIGGPGRAAYVTGTVECMTPVFGRIRLDARMAERNFCCYESALPGKYLSIVFNFTGGSLLKWCRDTLWPEWAAAAARAGRDPYDAMLAGLPAEPTGILLLPHFTATGTPHLDTRSRGAIVGLRLDTRRAELVKAVLEGVTYEMALNARLQRESGIRVNEYRAIGGGARSAAWLQIKADILGTPVARMAQNEAGCLGGAMLGLAALKEFSSAAEASRVLSKVVRVFQPDARRHARYAERLDLYARLYPALKETVHGLDGLDRKRL